jgi:hypothetical protein
MHIIRSIALFAFFLSLSIHNANACSCVKHTEVQQFRDAKVVVVGLVQETHYIEDQKVFGGGYIRAVIDVRETIKGNTERYIEVKDQIPEGGMCSSFLRAGIEFVLFINEAQEVGMCSGTHPLRATIYDRPEKLKELHNLKLKAGS